VATAMTSSEHRTRRSRAAKKVRPPVVCPVLRQQYAGWRQRFARVLSLSARVDLDHREMGVRRACRKPENGCPGVR
jgi:hypothetical protein